MPLSEDVHQTFLITARCRSGPTIWTRSKALPTYKPAGRPVVPGTLNGIASPWGVASAAPRRGSRPSRHVPADGVGAATGRDRLPGNLAGVPHVGHLRPPLLERAVRLLPARVPRLRVEPAGLSPRRARCVTRVGGGRRVDELANGGSVQRVGSVIEVEQAGPPAAPPCPLRPAPPPRACVGSASGAACRRPRARGATSRRRRRRDGFGAGSVAPRQTARSPRRRTSTAARGPRRGRRG